MLESVIVAVTGHSLRAVRTRPSRRLGNPVTSPTVEVCDARSLDQRWTRTIPPAPTRSSSRLALGATRSVRVLRHPAGVRAGERSGWPGTRSTLCQKLAGEDERHLEPLAGATNPGLRPRPDWDLTNRSFLVRRVAPHGRIASKPAPQGRAFGGRCPSRGSRFAQIRVPERAKKARSSTAIRIVARNNRREDGSR